MPERVFPLTFPMPRESEAAFRLKAFISDMLLLFSGDHSDDVLSEYVTVLVCNGKSQRQARVDLEAFLGEQSGKFVACLWELLLKDFSQGKPKKSASEPTATVDFGSYDTLIEQGSSSRKRNDYEQKATNATNSLNEKLISATDPVEDGEAHVSPKDKNMKMLRRELANSPARRTQPKEEEASGINYSRKVLRSVIVSAIKQPCGRNPDKYGKSMDKRSEILQNRPYLPEEMGQRYSQSVPSGRAVSARSHDDTLHPEVKPRVSVWDRLRLPISSRVLKIECPILPKLGIQAHENKVLQLHGPVFPAAYSEQHSERVVPVVGYRHRVFQSHNARQRKRGTITSTETHMAHNLSRKRGYGIINPNSEGASVCEFSSVLQYKQAKQDVERPSLPSYQSVKPDLLSEIQSVKQQMQQLEMRINQSKQLKKQKIGELKSSPQSGDLQHQQGVAESRTIHVTNVHYAAKKEAISMFFSQCGVVENVTIVTDAVTRHPKGAAFVSFATKESVNKAIALSNTMFYSRPIKVSRHVVASGVMSKTAVPQVVTGS